MNPSVDPTIATHAIKHFDILAVALFFVLWTVIAIADTRRPGRTAIARVAGVILRLVFGLYVIGVLVGMMHRANAVGLVLGATGLLMAAIGALSATIRENPRRKFALLFALGAASGVVGLALFLVVTGSSLTDTAPALRPLAALVFLDLLAGVPVLVTLLDRTLFAGALDRAMRVETHAGPLRAIEQRHGPHLFPNATLHFTVPDSSEAQVRQRLAALIMPQYSGAVPEQGPFAFTRYIMYRGRRNPLTFDLDTAVHDRGVDLILRAREETNYVLAALIGIFPLIIVAGTAAHDLFAGGARQQRAFSSVEVVGVISIALVILSALLLHTTSRSQLRVDQEFLAQALGAELPRPELGVVGALFRTVLGVAFIALVLMVVGVVGLLAFIGLTSKHEALGAAAVVGFGWGLILAGMLYAGRNYARTGFRRDVSFLAAKMRGNE